MKKNKEEIFLLAFKFPPKDTPPRAGIAPPEVSIMYRLQKAWLRDWKTKEPLPFTVQCCFVETDEDENTGLHNYHCRKLFKCTSADGVCSESGRCFSDFENWRFIYLDISKEKRDKIEEFLEHHCRLRTPYDVRKKVVNYIPLLRICQKAVAPWIIKSYDADPLNAEKLTCVNTIVLALVYAGVWKNFSNPDGISPWDLWKTLHERMALYPGKIKAMNSKDLMHALKVTTEDMMRYSDVGFDYEDM